MFSTVHKVAGVGWLSDTSAESLRAFVERVFANFRDKNVFFTIAGKQTICGCQKTYTHTGTFPQTPFFMFRYVLWLCTGCQRTYTHTQTSSLKHPFLMHFYFTMKTFSFKHPFRCLDIHFYLSMWQSKSNWFLPF